MALPSPTIESVEAVVRAYADAGVRALVAPAVADLLFHEWVPGLMSALPDDLRKEVERRPASGPDILKVVREGLLRFHDTAGGRVRLAVAPSPDSAPMSSCSPPSTSPTSSASACIPIWPRARSRR